MRISGKTTRLETRPDSSLIGTIPLTLEGTAEPQQLSFIVDTAFTGELLISEDALPKLISQPTFISTIEDISGGEEPYQHVAVRVYWNNHWRTVSAVVSKKLCLIGTLLLEGHRLEVEFWDDGTVKISS